MAQYRHHPSVRPVVYTIITHGNDFASTGKARSSYSNPRITRGGIVRPGLLHTIPALSNHLAIRERDH
jgi:hypothetical protein